MFGVSKMKELLSYIALTYPKSEEGVKAQQLVDEALPYLEKLSFSKDTAGIKKYNVLFDFNTAQVVEYQKLKVKLDTLIKKRNFNYLKTSIDFYSKDTMFVAIHGLNGKGQAEGIKAILRDTEEEQDFNFPKNGMSISSDNYRVIQTKKNLERYKQIRDSIYY